MNRGSRNYGVRACVDCKSAFNATGPRSWRCVACRNTYNNEAGKRRWDRQKKRGLLVYTPVAVTANRIAAAKLLYQSDDKKAVGAWLNAFLLARVSESVARQVKIIENNGDVNPDIEAMMKEEWS